MIVYIYTFPNGKKYIGQTTQTLNQRARNGSGYKGCPAVYNAIQKYGWENIQKEIIECFSQEEMDALEQKLIMEYNTEDKNYGYNLNSGGHGGKKLQKETKEKLSEIRGSPVICLETKEVYASTGLAAKAVGLKDHKNIHLAIIGVQKTAKDFHWMYLKDYEQSSLQEIQDKMEIKRGDKKEVICLETKKIYSSTGEAAKDVGLSARSSIYGVVSGQRKSAAGFHWMYLEDYQKQNS